MVLFTKLVFADLKNKSAIEHNKYLVKVNEDEIKALAHNYYHFTDGNDYIPKEHFYAKDPDVFGHASLFQYINRTNSEMDSNTLADWLLNPIKPEKITERQNAVKEISATADWRQQLQAFGAAKKYK